MAAIASARTALDRASDALASVPSKRPRKPVEPPLTPAEHRRRHRPGFVSKIDADPELRAFIEARIDTMTFAALEEAVAASFPPERRVRKSATHQWWTARLAAARRQPNG